MWVFVICICVQKERLPVLETEGQETRSLKKHTVNINIFASMARSQNSHYCHSLGAPLLKGGPYINIYFVRSRTLHEINNSHGFSFPFASRALALLVLLFFHKQRPGRKQLEASLCISSAFAKKLYGFL